MADLDSLKLGILVEEHQLANVSISHPCEEDLLNVKKFKKRFKIDIIRMDRMNMEFDLINVNHAFVNALRRVLLAEVPSMAFDRISMYNTSVLPDEILAHRIGLCPVKVDPRLFQYKSNEETMSEDETLLFTLHVKYEKNAQGENVPRMVTSDDLKWVPLGKQAELLKGQEPELVTYSSPIVLTELVPGQEVELKAQCFKGFGADHAKFQPVATAQFKPLPGIKLLRRVTGEAARRLQKCFSLGVIEIDNENGEEVARVANPRLDLVSRNVFAHADLKDAVQLTLSKSHYVFKVESTGVMAAQELVAEAIKILIQKAECLLAELNELNNGSS